MVKLVRPINRETKKPYIICMTCKGGGSGCYPRKCPIINTISNEKNSKKVYELMLIVTLCEDFKYIERHIQNSVGAPFLPDNLLDKEGYCTRTELFEWISMPGETPKSLKEPEDVPLDETIADVDDMPLDETIADVDDDVEKLNKMVIDQQEKLEFQQRTIAEQVKTALGAPKQPHPTLANAIKWSVRILWIMGLMGTSYTTHLLDTGNIHKLLPWIKPVAQMVAQVQVEEVKTERFVLRTTGMFMKYVDRRVNDEILVMVQGEKFIINGTGKRYKAYQKIPINIMCRKTEYKPELVGRPPYNNKLVILKIYTDEVKMNYEFPPEFR
jgi:hypothetical protein